MSTHYLYKHSPIQNGAFQIFMMDREAQSETLCGEYIVLDYNEDHEITEKKLMNLISLLNGRDELINLSAEIDGHLLYERLPDLPGGTHRVLFRMQDERGEIIENALLTYTGGRA